jgi:hypothetical protein
MLGRDGSPQTTRRKHQASLSEQLCPATRRPLRQRSAASLQCVLTDSDTREDISVADTVTLLLFPFLPLPLAPVKGRGGQPSQGLADEPNSRTKGLGLDTLSRPVCNPYYKQP